ncbi:hypothetical protein PG994_008079 [Apiospora phragmitis]|uniref:Uncharacterized protein n=1 Tax=Apiospora phragmitis TaxID=2905665 RepID=A0ABR1UV41_9PEZI
MPRHLNSHSATFYINVAQRRPLRNLLPLPLSCYHPLLYTKHQAHQQPLHSSQHEITTTRMASGNMRSSAQAGNSTGGNGGRGGSQPLKSADLKYGPQRVYMKTKKGVEMA